MVRPPVRLILAVALLTLAVGTAVARQGATTRAALPFTVISPDARRPLAASLVGDHVMVALDDLASIFQLTVRDDALAGGVMVTYKGRTVILTAGQALASSAGRLVSLPAPPAREGRQWLVPVEFVGRALGPIYDARLEVRKNSRLVLVGQVRVPRVAVRQEALGPQTRVTLAVSPRTPYTVSQEPSRVLVHFEADALDASLPSFPPQGLLQSIRVSEAGRAIAIDVGPRFGSFRASQAAQEEGGVQVLVDLMPAPSEPAPPRGSLPPLPVPAPPDAAPLPAQGPAAGIRTVVIDPGHGGEDTGAKGVTGVLEKDVTIAIARHLKALLEARLGLRVLLTRDGDQAVPLDDRAALANSTRADLFVSLHAGASVRPSAGGAQIYSLAADQAAEDPRMAAVGRQTLPAVGGGSRDIEMIPWDMAQIRYLSQSAALSGAIEEQCRGRVRMGPRPVLQAPLRVLAGASMPAVLVEVGFLTNPDEEQQLASEAYQMVVAQALVDGLLRYRDVADTARAAQHSQPPSATAGARRRP